MIRRFPSISSRISQLPLSRGERLFKRALKHQTSGNLEKAEGLYLRAIPIFEDEENRTKLANIYNNRATIAAERGDLKNAEQLYSQVLKTDDSLENKKAIALAYGGLGKIAYDKGDNGRAYRLHTISRELHSESGDREGEAFAYNHLSHFARIRGDLEEAYRLCNKARHLCKEEEGSLALAETYTELGLILEDNENLGEEKPSELYNKALNLYKNAKNDSGLAKIYYIQGTSLNSQECGKGEELLHKALGLCESLGDEGGIATIYNDLGNMERLRENPQKAHNWYSKALNLHTKSKSILGMGKAHAGLAMLAYMRDIDYDNPIANLVHTPSAEACRHMQIAEALFSRVEALNYVKEVRKAMRDFRCSESVVDVDSIINAPEKINKRKKEKKLRVPLKTSILGSLIVAGFGIFLYLGNLASAFIYIKKVWEFVLRFS